MKNARSLSTLLLSVMVLMFISCKEAKKEESHNEQQHSEKKEEGHDQREQAMQHEDQEVKATFKDSKTGTIFAHYLALKDALVKSDPALAATGAQAVLEATGNEVLKEAANTIASSKSIKDQRKAFVTVTVEVEKMLQGALASGEVYKQYCPMAFDNTGGYWFSTEKQIMNPYFGDMMLHCGTVKETIK